MWHWPIWCLIGTVRVRLAGKSEHSEDLHSKRENKRSTNLVSVASPNFIPILYVLGRFRFLSLNIRWMLFNVTTTRPERKLFQVTQDAERNERLQILASRETDLVAKQSSLMSTYKPHCCSTIWALIGSPIILQILPNEEPSALGGSNVACTIKIHGFLLYEKEKN